MNPHKYINPSSKPQKPSHSQLPFKNPDTTPSNPLISVNQKQSNQKISEKEFTDLQSLVKKSVDDINVLFSLKQIQSSFSNIEGYRRKHQSLSVGKNIQRQFHADDNNTNTTQPPSNQDHPKQNFTFNINNYINVSNKTKSSHTIDRYTYDDECSYDNINTNSINNTARVTGKGSNNVTNLNLVRNNRKTLIDKKDKRERSMNGGIPNTEKKKPSYQSYVNVKKKCTKKLYGDCNNSVNVNVNDMSMQGNSARGGNKGNGKGNRNGSPGHMEGMMYKGNGSKNSGKSNLVKKNHFNSANTSRKLFNKVTQFQQQQQQSLIHNMNNNNKHNTTFTSISQIDMMLTQTQQPSQSALTKTISREVDLNYNPNMSLTVTSTSFNNTSTNTNNTSSTLIKVQKARSSSIAVNSSSLNSSINQNTITTSACSRSRHNPSPLHKPSSSLLFSSSNYHSILNKIYSKEFPLGTLTTNDILKLMLFLNEYLLNSNALKDINLASNKHLLSNYSSFLSEHIVLDFPETEDIDHSKLDKVVNCTKIIQRKWRECTMRTFLGEVKDEKEEIKKMVISSYIMRSGFKIKKIIGLFNSTAEAFNEIVNETEMNEMLYNIIKLIGNKLTRCEKHSLYKQYINNVILNNL